jgi:hypothetical protein
LDNFGGSGHVGMVSWGPRPVLIDAIYGVCRLHPSEKKKKG